MAAKARIISRYHSINKYLPANNYEEELLCDDLNDGSEKSKFDEL
jgi:hypothetical protein